MRCRNFKYVHELKMEFAVTRKFGLFVILLWTPFPLRLLRFDGFHKKRRGWKYNNLHHYVLQEGSLK